MPASPDPVRAAQEAMTAAEQALARAERTVAGRAAVRSAHAAGHTEGGHIPAQGAPSVARAVTSTVGLALRAIERAQPEDRAARRLERMARSDDREAAYLAAVGDPAYASAFAQVMRDPLRAGYEMTDAERAAMVAVREATIRRDLDLSDVGVALPLSLDPSLILINDGAVNPLRTLARTITVTQKVTKLVTADDYAAGYITEGGDFPSLDPSLDQPEITAHLAGAYVEATFEALDDWRDSGQEIARLFADARDILEAEKFAIGSGINEPEGLFTGTPSGAYSAAVATLTAAQEALAARWQPRARWLSALAIRNDIGQIVAAADASDAPIVDAAGNILGKPWSEVSFAPATALLYGDIRSAFVIADRAGMRAESVGISRNTSTGAPKGKRQLLAWWRSGSAIVVPEALELLAPVS